MSALRLGEEGTHSPRHAVVGSCTEEDAVYHVGILDRAQHITSGDRVSVFHMADPQSKLELPGTMEAHALGWILDLGDSTHQDVNEWIEEMMTGELKIEYVAFPSYVDTKDLVTGRRIGKKFSCAGFVHACYEEALQIELIVSTDQLPEASRDVLLRVWEERYLCAARRYGLRGPGPWKVLLPSYLFHALSKTRVELPHKPPAPVPYFRP